MPGDPSLCGPVWIRVRNRSGRIGDAGISRQLLNLVCVRGPEGAKAKTRRGEGGLLQLVWPNVKLRGADRRPARMQG
jgi:hypothetical protein